MSPTQRQSLVALVPQPGQRTRVHDHIAWCILGVYRGIEREIRSRLVENDAEQWLLPTGSIEAYPARSRRSSPQDIHCVTAEGNENAVRMHVY